MFIVGIFDFLRTVEVARIDPKWATPVTSTTGYAVAAMFYLDLLLRDVALCPRDGSAARRRATDAEAMS